MPTKILLAEDSLTIQKVFELAFARTDAQITVADDGNDAVRLAGEIRPDLVVADVTLPGRNGFEVASELSQSGVPVLILSGTLGAFDEEAFKACGAKGVIFKPFEMQELIDKVTEAAASSGQGRAAAAGEPAGEGDWDFSDVLEEIDISAALPGAAASAAAPFGAANVPVAAPAGAFAPAAAEAAPEPPPFPFAEPAPAAAPAEPTRFEAAAVAPETEAAPVGYHEEDSPSAVTDLSPLLSSVEEIGEIEGLEEMELLHKESELPGVAAAPPEPEPEPEVAVVEEAGIPQVEPVAEEVPANEPVAEEPLPEPEPEPVPESVAAAPEAGAPAEEPPSVSADELREMFSARVGAAVEAAAAEAVEKAVWEWTGRLSSEFTERIREVVESVAWEVIPRTAEAVIREEIARLREERKNGSG